MAAENGASSAVTYCLCILLLPAVCGFRSEERECVFSDQLGAEPPSGLANELQGVVRENSTIRCSSGSRCYGLWEKRPNGEIFLVKQGCWTYMGGQQECHSDRCVVTATPSQIQNSSYRFCCCSCDLCNANFTEAPPTDDAPALRPMRDDGRQKGQQPFLDKETALIALLMVAIAAALIVSLFLGHRLMRGRQKHTLSALEGVETANTEFAVNLENLKLLELIGRGRYGAVFRGCFNERCMAVKIFSAASQQNYANERSIYSLPLLQHDNIACFLSADERTTAEGYPEFLILMEFYPHGCLGGYLSLHTVDWLTCCRMTHGITRGLAFLHTELSRADQYKPAVAHRDVTSRNVLVRADLSCVLADFGLSMRLTGTRPCRPGADDTMAISEVGTIRYMAPEVLGGALNLRDCESALKQVDVYALGLLYWETFRRCSDLFPGDPVPDYQLAFQAELGNHPSFEEMQILVVREKHRPRFPEAWKENLLVLRSLMETMEDCWDQDAEARLTAQCAEERLTELKLLSAHTVFHRNPSHVCWPPQSGSASSNTEDLQVGAVKNLQGSGSAASGMETVAGVIGARKNRNLINYERQQTQGQASSSDSSVFTTNVMPARSHSVLTEHTGDAVVPSIPIFLQLTEDDLEATKLNPKEVDKNLQESTKEVLMEYSQKHFCSSHLSFHIPQAPKENSSLLTLDGEQGDVSGIGIPLSSSIPCLTKQENRLQRPSNLSLPRTKETLSSIHLKLGKHQWVRSDQVETGVAKMNMLTAAAAAEPHLVTTVTNNTRARGCVTTRNRVHPPTVAANSYSAGVPTLRMSDTIDGGRTNLAGPHVEEEDKMARGMITGEDSHVNLLNTSPDEYEPLLRGEQQNTQNLHLQHQSRAPNILSGRRSNSNNNNNRLALGSDLQIKSVDVELEMLVGSGVSQGQGTGSPWSPSQLISGSPASSVKALTMKVLSTADSGPRIQISTAENMVPTPGCTDRPKGHLVHSTTADAPRSIAQRAEEPDPKNSTPSSKGLVLDTLTAASTDPTSPTLALVTQATGPRPPILVEHLSVEDPEVTSQDNRASYNQGIPVFKSHSSRSLGPEASDPVPPALEPQALCLLRPQLGQAKARRPERPCSLDLSLSYTSSDDAALTDLGALSASGEKIKRRVKTPYTLKKWRPASWVFSTDTGLDPDLEFSNCNSGQSHESIIFPKISQFKSSVAVFLVEGGTTATTATEPDGMTCF